VEDRGEGVAEPGGGTRPPAVPGGGRRTEGRRGEREEGRRGKRTRVKTIETIGVFLINVCQCGVAPNAKKKKTFSKRILLI
jgi:hypothetical protein